MRNPDAAGAPGEGPSCDEPRSTQLPLTERARYWAGDHGFASHPRHECSALHLGTPADSPFGGSALGLNFRCLAV